MNRREFLKSIGGGFAGSLLLRAGVAPKESPPGSKSPYTVGTINGDGRVTSRVVYMDSDGELTLRAVEDDTPIGYVLEVSQDDETWVHLTP